METIRTAYDVTLAPLHPELCCNSQPSNLTGSYGLSDDECYRRNYIYRNHGGVCLNIMNGCINPKTDAQKARIDAFCGPSATPGFYYNGAYWSIS